VVIEDLELTPLQNPHRKAMADYFTNNEGEWNKSSSDEEKDEDEDENFESDFSEQPTLVKKRRYSISTSQQVNPPSEKVQQERFHSYKASSIEPFHLRMDTLQQSHSSTSTPCIMEFRNPPDSIMGITHVNSLIADALLPPPLIPAVHPLTRMVPPIASTLPLAMLVAPPLAPPVPTPPLASHLVALTTPTSLPAVSLVALVAHPVAPIAHSAVLATPPTPLVALPVAPGTLQMVPPIEVDTHLSLLEGPPPLPQSPPPSPEVSPPLPEGVPPPLFEELPPPQPPMVNHSPPSKDGILPPVSVVSQPPLVDIPAPQVEQGPQPWATSFLIPKLEPVDYFSHRFVNTFEDAIIIDSDSDEDVVTHGMDEPSKLQEELVEGTTLDKKVSPEDFLDIQLSRIESTKCARDNSLLQENLYWRQLARAHGLLVHPRFQFGDSSSQPLTPSEQATTSMDSIPFTDGNVSTEDIVHETQVYP
jgi:hypothetical protein